MATSCDPEITIESALKKLHTEQNKYVILEAVTYGKHPLPRTVVKNSLMIAGGVFNKHMLRELLTNDEIAILLEHYILIRIFHESKTVYMCPQLLPTFSDRRILPWITVRIIALPESNPKKFVQQVLGRTCSVCIKQWHGDELLRYTPLLFSAFTFEPGTVMNLVQSSDTVMDLHIPHPAYPTDLRSVLEALVAILEPIATITVVCSCPSNISLKDTLENTPHECDQYRWRWHYVCVRYDPISDLNPDDGD